MEQSYVARLSGLVGALIGSAASITTVIVQAHYQTRLERTRLAVDAAVEDYKVALKMSEAHPGPGPFELFPLSAYIYFHREVIEALESGKATPETMRRIYRRQNEMLKVIREVSLEARTPSSAQKTKP